MKILSNMFGITYFIQFQRYFSKNILFSLANKRFSAFVYLYTQVYIYNQCTFRKSYTYKFYLKKYICTLLRIVLLIHH